MSPLVAKFNDIESISNVLSDGAEQKFLEFCENVDNWKKLATNLQAEIQRQHEQIMKLQTETNTLNSKLRNAKHLIDVERQKRMDFEDEKNQLVEQIGLVYKILGKDNVDQTREKLQILSSTFRGNGDRRSTKDINSPSHFLSTINENGLDTLGSILSVSDIDLTEDDIETSRLRSGRTYKAEEDNSIHKRKSTDIHNRSDSKRISGRSIPSKEAEMNVVYKDMNGVTEIKAQVNLLPSAPPMESTDDEAYQKPQRRKAPLPPMTPQPQPTITPQKSLMYMTPQPNSQLKLTPTSQGYNTPTRSPMRNYSSNSKMNARQHSFHTKTVYKVEQCQPCGKRIKFSKVGLKCRDCRAVCHPECREAVPLPCIPTALTPGRSQMGSIADYTPKTPPMVPAIVVHCSNEVEQRGLVEVGIYRVPGSEKDVKELKERFLRGKGVPNLSHLDINVVCGCLKDFLKSLKEPLVTWTLWNVFAAAAEKEERSDSYANMYQAISELPQPNRDTLAWLILHLQKVADCPNCLMPITNLARVFGPTVVGFSTADPDPQNMYKETHIQARVMERLLEISSDYWSNFLHVADETTYPTNATPEGGSLLGKVNGSRRRSLLGKTPLMSRESMTPRTRR